MITNTSNRNPIAYKDSPDPLKKASKDLIGIFHNEMMKAMRSATISENDLTGSAGERMFVGMMDENISNMIAQKMENSFSAKLFEQLNSIRSAAK